MDRANEGSSSLNNFTTTIDIPIKIFFKTIQCNAPCYLNNILLHFCTAVGGQSCYKLNPVVLNNTFLH